MKGRDVCCRFCTHVNGYSYPFFFFYVFSYIEPVGDCVLLCNTFISTEDYGVFRINFNVNRTVLRERYPVSQLMFFSTS